MEEITRLTGSEKELDQSRSESLLSQKDQHSTIEDMQSLQRNTGAGIQMGNGKEERLYGLKMEPLPESLRSALRRVVNDKSRSKSREFHKLKEDAELLLTARSNETAAKYMASVMEDAINYQVYKGFTISLLANSRKEACSDILYEIARFQVKAPLIYLKENKKKLEAKKDYNEGKLPAAYQRFWQGSTAWMKAEDGARTYSELIRNRAFSEMAQKKGTEERAIQKALVYFKSLNDASLPDQKEDMSDEKYEQVLREAEKEYHQAAGKLIALCRDYLKKSKKKDSDAVEKVDRICREASIYRSRVPEAVTELLRGQKNLWDMDSTTWRDLAKSKPKSLKNLDPGEQEQRDDAKVMEDDSFVEDMEFGIRENEHHPLEDGGVFQEGEQKECKAAYRIGELLTAPGFLRSMSPAVMTVHGEAKSGVLFAPIKGTLPSRMDSGKRIGNEGFKNLVFLMTYDYLLGITDRKEEDYTWSGEAGEQLILNRAGGVFSDVDDLEEANGSLPPLTKEFVKAIPAELKKQLLRLEPAALRDSTVDLISDESFEAMSARLNALQEKIREVEKKWKKGEIPSDEENLNGYRFYLLAEEDRAPSFLKSDFKRLGSKKDLEELEAKRREEEKQRKEEEEKRRRQEEEKEQKEAEKRRNEYEELKKNLLPPLIEMNLNELVRDLPKYKKTLKELEELEHYAGSPGSHGVFSGKEFREISFTLYKHQNMLPYLEAHEKLQKSKGFQSLIKKGITPEKDWILPGIKREYLTSLRNSPGFTEEEQETLTLWEMCLDRWDILKQTLDSKEMEAVNQKREEEKKKREERKRQEEEKERLLREQERERRNEIHEERPEEKNEIREEQPLEEEDEDIGEYSRLSSETAEEELNSYRSVTFSLFSDGLGMPPMEEEREEIQGKRENARLLKEAEQEFARQGMENADRKKEKFSSIHPIYRLPILFAGKTRQEHDDMSWDLRGMNNETSLRAVEGCIRQYVSMDTNKFDFSSDEAVAKDALRLEELCAKYETLAEILEEYPTLWKSLPKDLKDSYLEKSKTVGQIYVNYRIRKTMMMSKHYQEHTNRSLKRVVTYQFDEDKNDFLMAELIQMKLQAEAESDRIFTEKQREKKRISEKLIRDTRNLGRSELEDLKRAEESLLEVSSIDYLGRKGKGYVYKGYRSYPMLSKLKETDPKAHAALTEKIFTVKGIKMKAPILRDAEHLCMLQVKGGDEKKEPRFREALEDLKSEDEETVEKGLSEMAMLFFEHGEETRKECGYSYGTESLRSRTALDNINLLQFTEEILDFYDFILQVPSLEKKLKVSSDKIKEQYHYFQTIQKIQKSNGVISECKVVKIGEGDPKSYDKAMRKDTKEPVIDPDLFMRKKAKSLVGEMLKLDNLTEINESIRLLQFYGKKTE